MQATDELKKSSAIADHLYATIKEETDFDNNIPTVAMMILTRFFAEQGIDGNLLNAGRAMAQFTEHAPVLMLAYYVSIKQHNVKSWVDFDINVESLLKEKGASQ
jgi:hypothetical protein